MNTSRPKRQPHPEDLDAARPPDLAAELKRRGADQLVAEGVPVEQLLFAALRDTLGSARAMSYRRAVFEAEQDRSEREQRAVVCLWVQLSASVQALAGVLCVATNEPEPAPLLSAVEGDEEAGPAEVLIAHAEPRLGIHERQAAEKKRYRLSAG